MITPRPSPDNSTPKPGFPMTPFFGIDPVLMDDYVRPIGLNYLQFYNCYCCIFY